MGNITLRCTRMNSVIYRNYQRFSCQRWKEVSGVPATESQRGSKLELDLRDKNKTALILSWVSYIYIFRIELYPEFQACLSHCLRRIHAWMSNTDHACNMLKTELLVFPYSFSHILFHLSERSLHSCLSRQKLWIHSWLLFYSPL